MTEYGRGPGSEPWHPEDPLYGDEGWRGQQAAAAGHAPYDGQSQQQYPQGPQDPYSHGQYARDQYAQNHNQHPHNPQNQHPHDQYPHDQYGAQQGSGQYQDPYNPGGQYQDPYGHQQQPQQHPQQHQQQHPQHHDGGWDPGGQSGVPYGADPSGTYGTNPSGYTSREEADYYGTSEAYPPPQPPSRRRTEPEPVGEWDAEAGQEEENHPFFTGDDGRGDDDGHDDGRARRGGDGGRDRRGKSKKKGGRNGLACLLVAAVLGGGLGVVGYFGYQFLQGQFGDAPDFEGTGIAATVEVTIPKHATGSEIGNILKEHGVVKSVDAFVAAQIKNPKGGTIQDGVYLLKKEQSAESAVKSMLDPASRNNLTIPEGWRNAKVYELIDKRLDLKAGTAEKVAEENADSLGLPDWAKNHKDVKDPLEGFLFPAAYPVSKNDKPESILKKMVARANAEYEKAGLESKAVGLGLEGPWELLTLASLVQVEGKTHDDFRKMSEVIYNRLKPENTETNQLLQFDSAFNYLKGQSEIDISEGEINSNQDPYNTYRQKGLTPGPISNPGNVALAAAVNPTSDGWLYFVATDGMEKTEFAKTFAEHQKLVDKFNDTRGG